MKYPKIEQTGLYDLDITKSNNGTPFGETETELTRQIIGISSVTNTHNAISVKKIPGAMLVRQEVMVFLQNLANAGMIIDLQKST